MGEAPVGPREVGVCEFLVFRRRPVRRVGPWQCLGFTSCLIHLMGDPLPGQRRHLRDGDPLVADRRVPGLQAAGLEIAGFLQVAHLVADQCVRFEVAAAETEMLEVGALLDKVVEDLELVDAGGVREMGAPRRLLPELGEIEDVLVDLSEFLVAIRFMAPLVTGDDHRHVVRQCLDDLPQAGDAGVVLRVRPTVLSAEPGPQDDVFVVVGHALLVQERLGPGVVVVVQAPGRADLRPLVALGAPALRHLVRGVGDRPLEVDAAQVLRDRRISRLVRQQLVLAGHGGVQPVGILGVQNMYPGRFGRPFRLEPCPQVLLPGGQCLRSDPRSAAQFDEVSLVPSPHRRLKAAAQEATHLVGVLGAGQNGDVEFGVEHQGGGRAEHVTREVARGHDHVAVRPRTGTEAALEVVQGLGQADDIVLAGAEFLPLLRQRGHVLGT